MHRRGFRLERQEQQQVSIRDEVYSWSWASSRVNNGRRSALIPKENAYLLAFKRIVGSESRYADLTLLRFSFLHSLALRLHSRRVCVPFFGK